MRNGSSPQDWREGLGEAEALALLKAEGYNELPRTDKRTPFRIVLEVLREPMLMLLLGGGAVYMALGDLNEALILLVFATLSILITVVQESRTERVLETLRDLTSPRALVIRGGERRRIPGREVVRGDLLVLSEGDRVPADAVLLQASDLQTDESLLTGESAPVRKIASANGLPDEAPRPGGDDLPYVFSGSLIVRGTGLARTAATGPRSEIGKIGQSLHGLEIEPPRLLAQVRRVVRVFAMFGGAVSLLAVVLYGLFRGGWLDAVLAGIALGMSMLPEEFPVVLTVFMAMGAWRISQARVLTRRAAAIETLGAATVLCTDKTGTLTENRMSIAELRLPDGGMFRPHEASGALPGAFRELASTGLLACAPDPFDPMEKAFHDLGHAWIADGGHPADGLTLERTYGVRPGLLAMSQFWQNSNGAQEFIAAAKGAPEAIAELCRLGPAETAALKQSASAMADNGLRVLGIARALPDNGHTPESQRDFAFEFLGLTGLADPLRDSVPAAVRECRSAGVRVIMITGDFPATARAIAAQAGIGTEDIVTGEELDQLGDAELAKRVRTAAVFARIMPEQKLRIVSALKANGEIVAMTGDGVNDAPSLKAAHIGIAMGGRGTDVAREASSMVLLDGDFGSIVKTLKAGRRIYDNLRKAMAFIFAVHVPVAGLALLPLITGMPILFWPVHIAFLEMVIDPVCSLVFEAEPSERDIMRRPPRTPDEPLFSAQLVVWSLLQGVVALVVAAGIYSIAVWRGMPDAEVRALAFFSLVVIFVGLIFVNRSFSASLLDAFRKPGLALVTVLVTVTVLLSLTLLWPTASALFRFGPLHANDLAVVAGAGAGVLAVLEMLKPLFARQRSG